MAKLIINPRDILEEYNILEKDIINDRKKIIFENDIEKEIYNILVLENLTIDELIRKL
jgi:hypothetical protein